MAYQIEYGRAGTAKYVSLLRRKYRKITAVLLISALLLALIWSTGCDWRVTVAAMDEMAEHLSQGSDIQEAFSAFCIEILKGAEPG